MEPLITPKLDLAPVDERGFFTRVWYLFFNSITNLANYLLVQVTNLLARDYVYGGSALTTVNKIPKVASAGTLGNSAISDDGTIISILARIFSAGTATPWASATFQAHAATDQNFVIGQKLTLADGITLYSFNDAANANKSLELRALAFLFAVGKVGILTAGAPAYPLDVLGDVNTSTVYRVGGTQVVGPQLAAVAAPTINTTTITLTATSPYGANEVSMLNSLKAAVNQLNADVASLQTTVNDLRSRLSTTGITA